jgi:hypothetical protein
MNKGSNKGSNGVLEAVLLNFRNERGGHQPVG